MISLLLTTALILSGCYLGYTFLHFFGKALAGGGKSISTSEYLQAQGTPTNIIHAIVNKNELTEEDAACYAVQEHEGVRMLIAQNPYISLDLLDQLSRDSSYFVRSGAAENINITADMLRRLARDKESLVIWGLARNPMVPEEILLELYRSEKRSKWEHWSPWGTVLFRFAGNPYCPHVIRGALRNSSKKQDKSAVAIEQWKPRWLSERKPEHMRLVNEMYGDGKELETRPVL